MKQSENGGGEERDNIFSKQKFRVVAYSPPFEAKRGVQMGRAELFDGSVKYTDAQKKTAFQHDLVAVEICLPKEEVSGQTPDHYLDKKSIAMLVAELLNGRYFMAVAMGTDHAGTRKRLLVIKDIDDTGRYQTLSYSDANLVMESINTILRTMHEERLKIHRMRKRFLFVR